MSNLAETWARLRSARNETERVLAVPRRQPDEEAAVTWAAARWPNVTTQLRPVQALALYELHIYGRVVGVIGVGHGKSMIMYLAAEVTGAKNPVLMMPPTLVKSFEREVALYQSWGYPVVPYTIVPYSMLSQPDASYLLTQLAPDLICADEAHNLRNRTAARTRRFLTYMASAENTQFVPMTGTFVEGSVMDAAHLYGLALREGSPLPGFGVHLNLWSSVLDPTGEPTDLDSRYFADVAKRLGHEDDPRRGVYEHIRGTPGVVMTHEPSISGVELQIEPVFLRVPAACVELATQLAQTNTNPDGSVAYDNPAHLRMAVKAALNGYWTKWDWDAIGGRDDEWLEAKRAWANACNHELNTRARPGYDTPALVLRDTLTRADTNSGLYAAAYAWAEHMYKPEPPRVAVWVDTYLIDWVVARADNDIIWYSSDAIEQALADRGVETWGAGTDLTGPRRTVGAAIRVQGTGKNLQAWDRAIVLEPPQSASMWEQMLGRLVRPGQQSTTVRYSVCMHATDVSTPSVKAQFQEELKGQPQKLLTATWLEAVHE